MNTITVAILTGNDERTLRASPGGGCEATSPKPASTKGYTAAVLIVSGASREPMTLTQSCENSLKGEAKKPIPADATITLTIKTAEGKSGQVKFKK
jgi:hypothetical protein